MKRIELRTKRDRTIAYIFTILVVYGISTRFDFQPWLLKYGNPMMTQMNQPKSYGNAIFTIFIMTIITVVLLILRKKSIKAMCIVALIGCLAAVATFKLYEWNTDEIVSVIEEKQGVLSSIGYWGGDLFEVDNEEEIIEKCEKLQPVSEDKQNKLREEYYADGNYLIDSITIWITYPEKYGHNFVLTVSVHGENVYIWKGYGNDQKEIVTFYENNGIAELVNRL